MLQGRHPQDARGPEKDDDLAFTKSTIRRIYDEIQRAIANSSLFKLVLWAALYTAGFMLFRTGVAALLGMLNSMWMAIGVGLLAGAVVVGQDQILSWARKAMTKKGAK